MEQKTVEVTLSEDGRLSAKSWIRSTLKIEFLSFEDEEDDRPRQRSFKIWGNSSRHFPDDYHHKVKILANQPINDTFLDRGGSIMLSDTHLIEMKSKSESTSDIRPATPKSTYVYGRSSYASMVKATETSKMETRSEESLDFETEINKVLLLADIEGKKISIIIEDKKTGNREFRRNY
jgi:hypothetical protein